MINRCRLSRVLVLVFCAVVLRPPEAAAQLTSNSFAPITWYNAGGNHSYSVAVGDLNLDGFPDIVNSTQCFPCNQTGVIVRLNNGGGVFGNFTGYATDGFGNNWQSVAIAPMDSDSAPDVVVLNSHSKTVSVMRGNGDGTLQAAVSYPLNIHAHATVSPNKMAVADLNGDGTPDVVVSESVTYDNLIYPANTRGAVSVLLNQGNGALAGASLYDSGGYLGAPNVLVADVNRDGKRDILAVNWCSTFSGSPVQTGPCRNSDSSWKLGTVGVLLGNGNGGFQTAVTYSSGGYLPLALATADLNRDGKADLVISNECSNQFCSYGIIGAAAVLMGNGDGSFQSPVNYTEGATFPLWIATDDIEGDGRTDVTVLDLCTFVAGCSGTTGTVSILLGNGDGSLLAPTLFPIWTTAIGTNPGSMLVSDLSSDGKPDIVVSSWNGWGVMLNQTPRAATTTALTSGANPSKYGQTVTFTAQVSSPAGGVPTGTVMFFVDGNSVGSQPLVSAVATLNLSSLGPGSHAIAAEYSSDNAFRASNSATVTQVVQPAATSTTLAASPNPAPLNQPVTLTATIAVTAPGQGSPSGNVQFFDDAVLLGSSATTTNGSVTTSSLITSALASGIHTLSASYGGDSNFIGSTSPNVSLTVAPKPDLIETTLTNPPAAATPGTSFSIMDTVLNQGIAASGSSTTRYYVSLDLVKDASDVRLAATRSIPGLEVGATSSGSKTLVIPASLALGSYWLIACADDAARVAESNETNNCRTADAPLLVGRPDLVESALTNPPAVAAPGTSFAVTDTVLNQGNAPSSSSMVQYFLSLDNLKNAGDAQLTATRSIPLLAPGATSSGSKSLTVPASLALGTYWLIGCADGAAVLVESEETNNCRTAAAPLLVALPDLVESSLTNPPAAASPGASFAVTDTVLNLGNAASSASMTRFYASLDPTKNSADVLLSGMRSIPGLAPGATSSGSKNVTLPVSLPLGTYWLIACADDAGVVGESDEANNCRTSGTTLLVGWPDLVELSLTNPPATAALGSTFTVKDTVLNQGNAPSTSSMTRYYFSLNAVKDAGDLLLAATRSVPVLAAGATSSATKTLTVPPGAVAGASYYVLACADDAGKVGESDESNNCRASAATVTMQ